MKCRLEAPTISARLVDFIEVEDGHHVRRRLPIRKMSRYITKAKHGGNLWSFEWELAADPGYLHILNLNPSLPALLNEICPYTKGDFASPPL